MKTLAKVFLILIGLLLVLYIVGFVFFQQYFLPNTIINGKDFGLKPRANFVQTYEGIWKNHSLELSGRNERKETIYPKDFDYIEKIENYKGLNENLFYWPIHSLTRNEYKVDAKVEFNEGKLNQAIDKLSMVSSSNIKDPVPAHIGYEQGKGYVVIPAEEGDRLNKEKLKKEILSSLKAGEYQLNLEEKKAYVTAEPAEDMDKMENHAKSLNEIESYSLAYNFSDRVENLRGEDLIRLYSQDEKGNLIPDREKAAAYVKELAKKYDTFKGTRDFNITGGGTVRIPGGIYGWLTDQEKTTDALMAAMELKEPQEMKPFYSREAQSRNVDDVGNTYIEIDIARQHMWMYKNGEKVLDTAVVTGDPTKGNGTPTGTHVIWSRERDRYLTGATWRSHVNYWMPFNWTGCGIHDSNWRSSYGGNIYRGNGSHGCVNTPPGIADDFYNQAFHGMPVIVYNSATQKI
ncbi:L,D-transpeptidase/peptidoglycan binding protein [Peptoniphilus sp. KCTC 25270]|uniref:L,D-transpeptidase family protein n=1 Tax=Peptoniphilus sp. KCTC 25270 TaxID=2897414 RepID=UPI001E64DE60|nr:L,D-transpeptidase family protein [Peptoniphilus sp. KCTC 25270]MCD1146586.1 L,D-transpeptidase/peptidoglycan binding protein [Peptoniphilus sp. KCTC 25270]